MWYHKTRLGEQGMNGMKKPPGRNAEKPDDTDAAKEEGFVGLPFWKTLSDLNLPPWPRTLTVGPFV
jgi:hypothetical protein